jgi:hypothetical protein
MLFLSFVLMFTVQIASAEDLYYTVNRGGLTGVISREDQSVDVRKLSMAGGAKIYVEGRKMMSDPTMNIIFYSASGDISSIEYPIMG